MWKFSLIALAVTFSLHADKIGTTNEMGGDEQQDGEDYAVTPGNPVLGDDPVTGEKNDPAACLSADTVKRYEVKSRKAVEEIKKLAAKSSGRGQSLRQVRRALQAGELLPKDLTSMGGSAKDSVPMFKKQKFVNLMDCKEWRDKVKSGDGELPLGSVLVFKGGRHGDARIKTPEGCSQGEGKDLRCSVAQRPLIGVFVKVVN